MKTNLKAELFICLLVLIFFETCCGFGVCVGDVFEMSGNTLKIENKNLEIRKHPQKTRAKDHHLRNTVHSVSEFIANEMCCETAMIQVSSRRVRLLRLTASAGDVLCKV